MTKGTNDKDAMRFNEGKPAMHLLPFWLLKDLAKVYEKGAEKYAPWNWIKGGSTDVCAAAMLRHYTAWQEGEDIDPETECHHQLHVAWNALALYHGYKTGVDTDAKPRLHQT